jgi:hypothetical protein
MKIKELLESTSAVSVTGSGAIATAPVAKSSAIITRSGTKKISKKKAGANALDSKGSLLA